MAQTILYIDFFQPADIQRRKMDGIRRFAKANGWNVRLLSCKSPNSAPDAIFRAITLLRPVGCIVELSSVKRRIPRHCFGHVPIVWLDPSGTAPSFGVKVVECDNAAIAAAAFRELSLAVPSSYAVVPFYLSGRKWSEDRVAAFQACCSEAGKDCYIFKCRRAADWEGARRFASHRTTALSTWIATLPNRCAVFAVNDLTAREASVAFATARRSIPYTATLIGADAAYADATGNNVSDISSVEIDFEYAGYAAAKAISEVAAEKKTTSFGPLLVVRRKSTRGYGRREPHILDAVEIIRREACNGLSVAQLSNMLPGSRKLLELRFREAMGHSVHEEIITIRLERVFTLLRRRDFPISAIAQFCGFRSDIALRELFHSRTGISMRRWRAEHAP